MKLAVVFLALVAAAVADSTLNVNGREFRVFSAKVGYAAAKAACEAQGTVLATICSGKELDALRAADLKAPVPTEFWIGLPSNLNHQAMISPTIFSSMDSGSGCRVLSNWASRPWSVYTKPCTNSGRSYICETGEVSEKCPVPIIDPVDPIDPKPEPTVIVDPVDPTPEPTVIVDPTPVIDQIEPERCPKEREEFKANGLPVEPQFEEGRCKYLAKQCNEEKCFCVKTKNGERNSKMGNLEVPLGQDYDCSKKPKKCFVKLFSALMKQASGESIDYEPQCTKAGLFETKQCDKNNECWCVKKSGKEQKKTRDSNGDAVKC